LIDTLTISYEDTLRTNDDKLASSAKQIELKRDAVARLEKQHRDLRAKATAIRI
jgi:hypothetical protein